MFQSENQRNNQKFIYATNLFLEVRNVPLISYIIYNSILQTYNYGVICFHFFFFFNHTHILL